MAAGREITKHANRMCLRHVEEAGEARRVGARGAAEGRGAAEEMGTSHLGVVVERKVVVGEGRVAAEVKGLGRVGRRSDSLIESRGQFPNQTTNECTMVFIIEPVCGNRDCFLALAKHSPQWRFEDEEDEEEEEARSFLRMTMSHTFTCRRYQCTG